MGFGTVFTMLAFLLIFAGMIVVVTGVQKTITAQTVDLKQQQLQQAKIQQQEITITATNYTNNSIVPYTTTYANEFSPGNFTNTTTAGDQVELQTTEIYGQYTSTQYNTGVPSNYTTISWSSVEPAMTNLTFQVRSAVSEAALNASTYIGPDGTSSTSYNLSGTSLHASHDGDQYLQWRASFGSPSAGITPELQDFTIQVQRISGHAKLVVENTGQEKLTFDATDVYVDGIRINRSQSNRVFSVETITDERLWNPGEIVNVTAFVNITVPTAITITNEFAKDQAVVNT